MPAPDPRTHSICVWGLSCLFLCVIIAGCVYLVLYIKVEPRSDYAILGLALIGTPWVFWFLTFMYRCCCKPVISSNISGGGMGRGGAVPLANTFGASAATSRRAAVDNISDSTLETSGARRVRFGDAVMVEEQSGNQQGHDNHQRTPSSSSSSSSRHNDYDDISSPETRECERPLASLTPSY